MTRHALLPSNSTRFERAVSETLDRSEILNPGADKIIWSNLSRNGDFLPALIEEYGLAEITQYVPSLANVIALGIAWQRVRGTPEAVRLALAWLNYIATLEEAPVFRRKWHAVQLGFPALPANDNVDLPRIEGAVGLSLPARSYLRRGFHQYDIRALEADASHLDGAMLDDDSGTRLTAKGTQWSFGRAHEFDHVMTQAECQVIGNWIPEGASLSWIAANYPWVTANYPWMSSAPVARKALMAIWFDHRPVYLSLKRLDGSFIGFRRARVSRPVRPLAGGTYRLGASDYATGVTPSLAYVEAMTDFDDGAGEPVWFASLAYGGVPQPGVKPGQLWIPAGGLEGFVSVAINNQISVPLRATVRERFKWLLRF
jgi:Phage tail protein (Tail_P2_I)